jgi:MoaA/NifB/PqqE/SkfB family radical SAM enzyme
MCLVSFSKNKDYSSKDKFSSWNKKSPVWAYIELTDYCSHNCAWCYGDFPNGTDKSLSLDDYRNVLGKLKAIGVKQLSIGGGEPTEHPKFNEILSITQEFEFSNVHLLTHGDNLSVDNLIKYGVDSVHFNYQGSEQHENVHGTPYETQLDSVLKVINSTLEATATITVGAYNLESISEIVKEVSDIGFDRIRFWEATGVGSSFLKDLNSDDVFDVCSKESKKNGYLYSHSYDPQYKKADINVPCIQASNLGMYIDYQGMVKYCGATKDSKFITSILDNTSEYVVDAYTEFNSHYSCNNCEARNPHPSLKVANL